MFINGLDGANSTISITTRDKEDGTAKEGLGTCRGCQ